MTNISCEELAASLSHQLGCARTISLPAILGRKGFEISATSGLEIYPLSNIPEGCGLVVQGKNLEENYVLMPAGLKLGIPLKVKIGPRSTGNLLIMYPTAMPCGTVAFNDSKCTVIFCEGMRYPGHFDIRMSGPDCLAYFGRNGSSNGVSVDMAGEGGALLIGEDYMISHRVALMNSDIHPIIDLGTMEYINKPQDIIINPHVWLGRECVIMKGVTLGFGCVVGYRSLVNKSFGNDNVIAGMPARVVRQNVGWVRPGYPYQSAIDDLQSLRRRVLLPD